MTHNELGIAIKYYRSVNSLDQNALAKIVGCSPSTLSKIEYGDVQAKAGLVLRILQTLSPNIKKELALLNVNAELHNNKELT